MNNKSKLLVTMMALVVLIVAGVSSCKKKFDAPPGPSDPAMTATHTLAQLKAMHTVGGAIDVINTDMIISGVVIANDKSGNLYKQIYIQDASGALQVTLDATNLYNTYPVGRRVFIKVKGLALSDYNGLMQLGIRAIVDGSPTIQGIPSGLIKQYLFGGSINNPVTVKVVTNINSLTTDMQDPNIGNLIQLNDFEFSAADTTKTYGDTSAYKADLNRTVSACNGTNVIIRTSGYANFAGVKLPSGKGQLLSIYTVFRTTKQLVLRDTADVKFTGTRCGQGPTTLMTTSSVRALFTGTTTTIPDGRKITGVVISDRTTSNLNAQNIVLQQGTGLSGILIRFSAAHSFNLGDSIDVNVSQQELSEFNSLLQVNNVPLSYASLKGTGKTITPRATTIADINTNFETWESTLVTVSNVSLSGGTTPGNYGGSVTLTSGVNTLVMFTASGATFANQVFPSNAASVTGYLSQFGTTKQLGIRNPGGALNDVVAGSGGGGGSTGLALTTSPYTQNFDGIGSGLPQGFFAKISATATALGSDMPPYSSLAVTPWNQTSAGLKNFASATGLTASATDIVQAAETNRAMGIRQTSSAGYDPGAAFVVQLANTTGKSNFQMSFKLQSLDNSIGRTTVWVIDYAIGDAPTSFTTITTTPASLSTSGTFSSTNVSVTLPAAVNNQGQKVWIRIVSLAATTGSGSRASTAIDDFQLTWN